MKKTVARVCFGGIGDNNYLRVYGEKSGKFPPPKTLNILRLLIFVRLKLFSNYCTCVFVKPAYMERMFDKECYLQERIL